MKTRYKTIMIIGLIMMSSLIFFLYDFYFTDHRGIVYPGTGSALMALEKRLCEKLSGDATFGDCFGINDICEDIYGILKYDKKRSEVGCSLDHRVDFQCTKLQLSTGWVKYSDSICFLPFEDELIDSRK